MFFMKNNQKPGAQNNSIQCFFEMNYCTVSNVFNVFHSAAFLIQAPDYMCMQESATRLLEGHFPKEQDEISIDGFNTDEQAIHIGHVERKMFPNEDLDVLRGCSSVNFIENGWVCNIKPKQLDIIQLHAGTAARIVDKILDEEHEQNIAQRRMRQKEQEKELRLVEDQCFKARRQRISALKHKVPDNAAVMRWEHLTLLGIRAFELIRTFARRRHLFLGNEDF